MQVTLPCPPAHGISTGMCHRQGQLSGLMGQWALQSGVPDGVVGSVGCLPCTLAGLRARSSTLAPSAGRTQSFRPENVAGVVWFRGNNRFLCSV